MSMYYLCADEAECQAKLDQIKQVVGLIAQDHGHTLDEDGNVIGKNAATGCDCPMSLTTKWHDPILLHDGSYGIMSLRERLPTHHLEVELVIGLGEPMESYKYTPPEEEGP